MKVFNITLLQQNKHIQEFVNSKFFPPTIIGAIMIISYGLSAPWLGFYGDDWSYIWLLFKGPGLNTMLGASRVGFVPFYEFLSKILGPSPIGWQVYMLLLRGVNAYFFWMILHKLWPQYRRYSIIAALFYAVYPGFYLHSVAVNISMFFVLLSCFYLSILLNLFWVDSPRKRWGLAIMALIFSAINLTLAEYFYFMEMVRPIILYLYYSRNTQGLWLNFKKSIQGWIPFFILFLLTSVWRLLFQPKLNAFYSMKLLDDISASPVSGITSQIIRMLQDLWQSGIFPWFNAVYPARLLALPNAPEKIFLAILFTLFIVFLIFQFLTTICKPDQRVNKMAMTWISLGLLWFFISGWSIWLPKLAIIHVFSTTRFTMPFIPGATLILTGLIMLLHKKRIVQLVLISTLLAGAVSTQLLLANYFRMDWVRQKSFFHQLTWRFPGLEKGTVLLISRNPMTNGEENSISAGVDWVYSRGNPLSSDYYAYFNPDKFYIDLGEILPGEEITRGHLVGKFTANLDRSVTLYLDSRNCIRTLYPDLDIYNNRLNSFIRGYISESRPNDVLISADPETARNLKQVFGAQQQHDWCWLYQAADLASQTGRWEAIPGLADQYLDPDEYSHDWQKLMVFVEAYARNQEWQKAEDLLRGIPAPAPGDRKVYCKITLRWLDELELSPSLQEYLIEQRNEIGCGE